VRAAAFSVNSECFTGCYLAFPNDETLGIILFDEP